MNNTEHIVIIGNGISGITAARHIRKFSNKKITVISAETEYFFSRTALMYVYMGHMKFEHTQPYEPWFWEKNNINLLFDYVKAVDFENKTLHLQTNQNFKYDKLILAVGSKPNKFGWKGQDLKGVQGLYSVQDLQQMEQNTANIKKAVVIGGGLIGIELCEMLHSRGIEVSYLVRENRYWGNVLPDENAKMIEQHIIENGIDLRLQTELDEILGDDNNKVKAIKTKSGEIIDCEFVGLAVGVSPNVDFLKSGSLEINRGIIVNEFLETNIPDVYAIGDCAEFKQHPTGRRNIEQVWYTGKMMGETVAQTICRKKTPYKPGIWFNSAKFFEIEYQTYGNVPAKPEPTHEIFYWEKPEKNCSLYFVFDKETKQFLGINTFGIRLRHEVCTGWIKDNKTIAEVIKYLSDAFFDPELYPDYHTEIIQAFNHKFNANVMPEKKSWKRILNYIKR
jgi:NAD(P)H-nitrite reductase large subunit